MKTKKQIQGKKARAAGARFERKVREDLESKGWIVDKWSNNVELWIEMQGTSNQIIPDEVVVGKLVKVKNKFLGPGKPMMLGAGFPDFIVYKKINDAEILEPKSIELTEFCGEIIYEAKDHVFCVLGVEVKSNGYLDIEEKEKLRWYLDNHTFSKILIAKKGKKRGEIEYVDFK